MEERANPTADAGRRVLFRCGTCLSTNVTRDASAAWNPDTQQWELAGVMDAAVCDDCGKETTLEEIPAG